MPGVEGRCVYVCVCKFRDFCSPVHKEIRYWKGKFWEETYAFLHMLQEREKVA